MSRKDNRTTEEFLLELKENGNWNEGCRIIYIK